MSRSALLSSDLAQSLQLADVVQSSPSGIVSRTLLKSPELHLILFHFAEGQELSAHSSPRRAVVQILNGQCEFFFEEKWHALITGAVLHLPPAHLHAVRASRGAFQMLLTLSIEPANAQST